MKIKILAGLTVLTASATLASANSPLVEFSTGIGGNGHIYQLIDDAGTFDQAVAAAAAMSNLGVPGHLVIFDNDSYPAEFDFVFRNVYVPYATAGNRIYWVGARNPTLSGADPRNGWSWIDGSAVPTSITNNWNIDVFEGPGDNGLGFFRQDSNTLWDYIANNNAGASIGYVVEFGTIPEPSSLAALAPLSLLLTRRRR